MAIALEPQKYIEIRLALQDLNSDFCYHFDHGDVDGLVDLFCEDALYSHGNRVSRNMEEIRQLFLSRKDGGDRTSRHMQTGLRVEIINENYAKEWSVCMTFAANTTPTVSPATPFLVADFIDEYRCCDDGIWRIAKRHIERIFVDPDNTGPIGRS